MLDIGIEVIVIKIAMLTNNYKPFIGGVPISIERLSNGLRVLGHEVWVFAPSYSKHEEEEFTIRYTSFPFCLDGGIVVPNSYDSKIEQMFCDIMPDVIHVHHPMLIGKTALYLSQKYSKPVVFTYHTRYDRYLHYLPIYSYLIEKGYLSEFLQYEREVSLPKYITRFANHCNHIFAPAETLKSDLIGWGVDTPTTILPTGLPSHYYESNHKSAKRIRRQYLGNKSYLLISVSRLSKEKNVEFLLRGLAKYKLDFGDCFRLLMIGDGPEKERLKDYSDRLGLCDNVCFVGNIENKKMIGYYAACDLFVFASTSETQGIVLLEAMAAHNPVVALKATGTSDVVLDGINGFLTEMDEEIWSRMVGKILSDVPLFTRLQNGAYATSLEYLDSQVAKKAEKIYIGLLNQNLLVNKKKRR